MYDTRLREWSQSEHIHVAGPQTGERFTTHPEKPLVPSPSTPILIPNTIDHFP